MDVQRNSDFIFELLLVIWAIGAIVVITSQARNTKTLKESLFRGTACQLSSIH